jgi:hypothetical protein
VCAARCGRGLGWLYGKARPAGSLHARRRAAARGVDGWARHQAVKSRLGAAHGSKGEAEGPRRERPTAEASRHPYVGARGARRVATRVVARAISARRRRRPARVQFREPVFKIL